MNIMPVKTVGHGTAGGSEFAGAIEFSFSGYVSTRYLKPSRMAMPCAPAPTCPSTLRARNGIINPPIKRPMPLIVSETATAFKPPAIA